MSPSVTPVRSGPRLLALVSAFAAVYVIWGSTYLGIKIAIETIPPLMMAGVRFTIAGALVMLWMKVRHRTPMPTPRQWRNAIIVGGLLLLTGNGLICIAQQRLPSGLTALLVATVPLWMSLIEWLLYRGARPTLRVFVGLAIGLMGVLVLIDPKNLLGETIHLPSAGLVLIACLSWSLGSLHSRRADLPKSLMLASGMEMLAAGVMLMLAAGAKGDWNGINLNAISPRSIAAFAYLIIFGSLVGFSAYIWLLKHVSPSAVSTYAYVNPMVAVFLGWAFAHEPVGVRTLLASALIIAAVIMITLRRNGSAAVSQSAATAATATSQRTIATESKASPLCPRRAAHVTEYAGPNT